MRFRDIHRVMRSPEGDGGGTGVADKTGEEKKPETKGEEKKPEEKKPDEQKPEDKKERKTLLDGDEKKGDEKEKAKEEEKKSVVPEKYELKLPAKSALSAPVLERTATISRELGLSNEAAQKMLDFVHAETASHLDAVLESARPGGAAWEKQLDEFEQQAKADPEIGGAKLTESISLAKRVSDTFFSKDIKQFLHESGLGSHPDLIRALAKIGRGMSEDKLLSGRESGGSGKDAIEDRWYKNSTSKKE